MCSSSSGALAQVRQVGVAARRLPLMRVMNTTSSAAFEREADQHALHVQAGQAVAVVQRQGQRPLVGRQQPVKHSVVTMPSVQVLQGLSSTAPRVTCSRYRKTKGLVAPPLR